MHHYGAAEGLKFSFLAFLFTTANRETHRVVAMVSDVVGNMQDGVLAYNYCNTYYNKMVGLLWLVRRRGERSREEGSDGHTKKKSSRPAMRANKGLASDSS